MTRKRACSVVDLTERVVGLHVVSVGLEDSHSRDLEANEHNVHTAKVDVDPGAEAILTDILSVIIAAFAESTNECLRHDPGNEGTDHGEDQQAAGPDVVDLSDQEVLSPDSESDDGGEIEGFEKDGPNVHGVDGEDHAEGTEDTDGDDSADKGAAAAAGSWLVISVDAHISE